MNRAIRLIPFILLSACTMHHRTLSTSDTLQELIMPTPPKQGVNSRYVTMSDLQLNGQRNVVTVRPRERIAATSHYMYQCKECNVDSVNQIIIGLAGRGAQSCIYSGPTNGSGEAQFQLKAPALPGVYDIRFRYAQAYSCEEAIKNWWLVDGAPGKSASIGQIIVTRKAEA